MLSSHRTPRYVLARLREIVFQKCNPGAPWLGPQAVRTLEQLLSPEQSGLECGAGRSTLWVARRVYFLESWEENGDWFRRVATRLSEKGISNVALKKVSSLPEEYLRKVAQIPPESLHFALVDSESAREVLAPALLSKIRPGGFLMLDNVNWFLPSDSRAPHSRSRSQGPLNRHWEAFLDAVAGWEVLWMSSGVTDTAFYIKPGASRMDVL